MIPPQVFVPRKILEPFPLRNQLSNQTVIYSSTPITPAFERSTSSHLHGLEVVQILFDNSDWISEILRSKDSKF